MSSPAQSLTASAINTVPTRYAFGRTCNNTSTSTPPEICLWLSNFPIAQEIHWISKRSVNKHLVRIASCLQRPRRQLYDVPEEDYPDLQFPLGATGHKSRYAMAPKRPTYPRGAKGLKRAGDSDVPSTRWVPSGIKLQPFDYQMFKLRGCFFPAPSNLRHVETLRYENEFEMAPELHDALQRPTWLTGLPAVVNETGDIGQIHKHVSDQNNVTSQPISRVEPTDYYGPSSNYAGSVSTGSDSCSDPGDRYDGTDDVQNNAVEDVTDIEAGLAGSGGAFATDPEAHEVDSMSVDFPASNSEVHDNKGFGVVHGQDAPRVKLRPISISQVSDIMYAADDGLDHDEVRSYRHLSLLPPLPEGYRYLVTPTMAFCRKPYLIVPVRSGRFDGKEQFN